MRAGVLAAMAAVMVVAGCATVRESRVNPFNWFGRSTTVAVAPGVVVRDGGRIPVAQVTELSVEPTRGGAIIRAKGVPPSQGWSQAALIREDAAPAGELTYRFVVRAPTSPQGGTPMSREVTVATFVSDFALESVRSITVTGAENARSTRRR